MSKKDINIQYNIEKIKKLEGSTQYPNIKDNELKKMYLIGKGGFGEVWEYFYITKKKQLAIKTYHCKDEEENFYKELCMYLNFT